MSKKSLIVLIYHHHKFFDLTHASSLTHKIFNKHFLFNNYTHKISLHKAKKN
jgi:hypothetical protein